MKISRIITEEINKLVNSVSERPLYAAVVLNDESKETLKNIGESYLNEKQDDTFQPRFICHHMTIAYGKALDDELLEWCQSNEGNEFELTATHIGMSEKAIGVRVSTTVPCKNKISHVTIAVNLNGGKPVDTNFIENWETLSQSIMLKGNIELIYPTKQ